MPGDDRSNHATVSVDLTLMLPLQYAVRITSSEACFRMSEDPETIGLRPMIVDGEVQVDDYEVVWRGLPIGRILKQPHTRHW